jgi:hypothetical protein
MSAAESDGITETVEDLIRVGLLLGVRLAERRARTREAQLHQAARQSLDAAERERARQLQQRASALASLEGVNSPAWWDHASATDIRDAWTVAREYQSEEPRAARAVWTITDQLNDRYGLDLADVDPAALGQHPQLPEHATLTHDELRDYDRLLRRQAATLQAELGTAPDDRRAELNARLADIAELRELIDQELGDAAHTATDRHQEARELADAQLAAGGANVGEHFTYDTAERRRQLADRLETLGATPEAVEAVVLTDTAQAEPPTLATSAASSRPAANTSRPRRTLQQQRRRGRN